MKSSNKIVLGIGAALAGVVGFVLYKRQAPSAGANQNVSYQNESDATKSDPSTSPDNTAESIDNSGQRVQTQDPRSNTWTSRPTEKPKIDTSQLKNNRRNRTSAQLLEVVGDIYELYQNSGINIGFGTNLIKATQEFLDLEQANTSLNAWQAVYQKLGRSMSSSAISYVSAKYGLNGVDQRTMMLMS